MDFSSHKSENADWLNQLKHIRTLKLQLKKGHPIGEIISEIGSKTISSFPNSVETFSAISTDYELMMNYMLTGMNDPSRAELYAQLVLRTYKLLGNIEMGLRLQHDADALSLFGGGVKPLDVRDIREKLEAYVSEMALLSLDSQ